MTCREKLKIEHPTELSDMWIGGCLGCPDEETRRYIAPGQTACRGNKVVGASVENCTKCWDTETPDTEPTTQEPETAPSEQEPTTEPANEKSSIPSMTDLQWLLRKALGYPGIAVSITFMEDAITFNAYPYPTQEEETNESR
jgi:hypothetical protein